MTADDERRDARTLFDDLWADGDPWDLETSPLDQARYDRQVELLADRRYSRALELGCAAGAFTRRLVPLCDSIRAIDVARPAIERAERAGLGETVLLQCADVMEVDVAEGAPWDLVVLAETAYYLGWARPLYDVGWLAHTIHEAMAPDGRLLLVNSIEDRAESLMSPWLVRTYRDLFVHTGLAMAEEETMAGSKEGVRFDILFTLLEKRG